LSVALLTGADDRNYAHDLALSLAQRGLSVDFIGSDDVRAPEHRAIRFLNLRGSQSTQASRAAKALRILRYYARLLAYAWTAAPPVFHILWNNKFEAFDRTLLMLWYRMAGRRIALTAHNVNAARRDGRDSAWNRLTLRVQYRLAERLFVHTEAMKRELEQAFGVSAAKVSVIPFATPDVTPSTDLTREEARDRLRIPPQDKVLLFFGQIVPYKGLEYLLQALPALLAAAPAYRLLVAGTVKRGHEAYWNDLQEPLLAPVARRVDTRVGHIAEREVELYFKAADALVLPYVEIYQSGVLFLAYRFGLPVVATDVGDSRSNVLAGRSGHVCAARDAQALSRCIAEHFASELQGNHAAARRTILDPARRHHSWSEVAAITEAAYRGVRPELSPREA
jgi:glycosyltransferase involved in cell wall biosynthesis